MNGINISSYFLQHTTKFQEEISSIRKINKQVFLPRKQIAH